MYTPCLLEATLFLMDTLNKKQIDVAKSTEERATNKQNSIHIITLPPTQ